MEKRSRQCEFLENCRFFNKFGQRESNVWQAIFKMYCTGHSNYLCEIYVQRKENGRFLAENIMPTGRPVSFVYRQLP